MRRKGIGGVVLPYRPVIDKIAAKAILSWWTGEEVPVVDFWKTNLDPSKEQMEKWRKDAIVAIDVGQSQKYHNSGFQSACEALVKKFELPMDVALRTLIDHININNATGVLKSYPLSAVWLLREAPKVGCDQLEVVSRVEHVIHVWLRAFQKERSKEHVRGDILKPRVLERVLSGGFRTLTLSEYFVNAVAMGTKPRTIVEHVEFFLNIHDDTKRRIEAARMAWNSRKVPGFCQTFRLAKAGCAAVFIVTDDEYLPREGIKYYPLVVVKNSRGNFAVLSRGSMDLFDLGTALMKREPGRWIHDPRQGGGLVANGTALLPDVVSTDLSDEEVIMEVSRLVVKKV